MIRVRRVQLNQLAAPFSCGILLLGMMPLQANADKAPHATLEEVVVTAQRRSQSLQDVPISLAVVSGSSLQKFNVTNFAQLKSYVPNFYVQDTPGNYAIFIRGMGSTSGNLAFEQTVGLFIDGVYAGHARQFQNPFLDISRIEILRGPQGALVGKNTSAGAINVITKKPTSDFEASIASTYEFQSEKTNTTAIVSGPITQKVLGRLALNYVKSYKGYTDNLAIGGSEPKTKDTIARGILLWEPTDSLDVTTKLERASSNIAGNMYETINGGLVPNYKRSTTGYPGIGRRDYNDTDSFNGTVTANYRFSGFTLKSISAYSGYRFKKGLDSDFTAVPALGSTFAADFEQVSQEVRLVSPEQNALNYVVGAYYQTNNYQLNQSTLIDFGPFNGRSSRHFNQHNRVWSAYGQMTYRFTDGLSASVGARETGDRKEAWEKRRIAGTVLPGWLATPLHGSRDRREFDGSAKIQWDVSENVMAYMTWAQGSKAGAFVGGQTTTTQKDFQVDEERANSYEIGTKSQFLDNSLSLNLDYFYTKYKDLQVSTWDAATSSFISKNAASATTKGIEVTTEWAINNNWSLKLSGAYLDAKYDKFLGAECRWSDPGCNVAANNIGGSRLPRSSKWSGNANVIYQRPMGALNFRANLGLIYNSSRQFSENFDPYARQDSFVKVDLRLAVSGVNDRWEVALIGKNLTDKTTFSHAFGTPLAAPRTFTYLVDPPRTIAVQGKYRF